MGEPKRRKKYVIKNRVRFFSVIVVAFLIIAGMALTTKSYSFEEPSYISIRVNSGDTLWGIASRYKAGGDIRKFIFDIKKLNNLSDSNIYEGQTLIIPENRR